MGDAPLREFTEKSFRAGEVLLNYAEGPQNGPSLLLLHGMARDWKSFSPLLPDLCSSFHVFALDLRGHGRSSHRTRGYRIVEFAYDISQFLRAILPSGASVFGHSLGAMAGMCAAAEPNSSINALIVGDSMISPANLAASIYDRLFVQLHQLMLRGGSCEDMARGIGKIRIQLPGLAEMLTIEELPGMTQASLFEWARCALQTDPDVLAMSLDGTSFEGWDPENTLPRIPCPVLLLQANPELDGLLSDADVALAKRLLPQAEHVKFPLLGHALFMQQPKPVLQAIVAFLEKYPSGGA